MSSMNNQFDNKGKRNQNVAQGEGAVGKQENVEQEVGGDGNMISGSGNVTVHQGLSLKPRTVVLASVLAIGVIGAGEVGWYLLAPKIADNNAPVINNTGGNVTVYVISDVSPEVFAQYIKESHATTSKLFDDGFMSHDTHNKELGAWNSSNISPDIFSNYVEELGMTKAALSEFFHILEEQQVPRSDLDSKLREISSTYKELLARLAIVQSEDPEVQQLKQEAGQAIEAGDYAEAEEQLNQAEILNVQAIKELKQADRQMRISAAATNADQAKLQRVLLRYAKAAEYWQKAATLLPKGEKKDRAYYLNEAGSDLDRISCYSEALPLYEQSLALYREIGNRAGEGTTLKNIGEIRRVQGDYGTALPLYERSLGIFQEIGDKAGQGSTLNNIGRIYATQGEYDTALKYMEQSLSIHREISDWAGEGTTLNTIGALHQARGDYTVALRYLEQSLTIRREIGDEAGEGTTFNNISSIYWARGDYETALKYLEQSLVLFREIGDKAHEGGTLNNISLIYHARGDYDTALKYLNQNLAIRQEIGDRAGEAMTSWNIGIIYKKQGDLAKAEQYMARTVEIAEEIGHPALEQFRKELEAVRTALQDSAGPSSHR